MVEPKRGMAVLVGWKSPDEQPMSLAPLAEQGGKLEVELFNGGVTLRGKHCRMVWNDAKTNQKAGEKIYGDIEITIPLSRSQINWKLVERLA